MAWQDRDYNREDFDAAPRMSRVTGKSVVTWLIIINTLLWFWDQVFGASLRGSALAIGPHAAFTVEQGLRHFQLWRLFTYQFIHGDFFHILFNMIALYFFGPLMVSWWGPRRFLAFYLLCGASGAVIFSALAAVPGLLPMGGYLIGASGSIFGILVGCAVLAPRQKVSLIFPPVTMQMKTMVYIFLGIAVLKIVIAHFNAGGEAAHLGGALLGFILVKQPWLLSFAEGFLGRPRATDSNRWMKQKEKTRRSEEAEQAEVDRILDKVRDSGLQSLTGAEKKALKRATEKQRREA